MLSLLSSEPTSIARLTNFTEGNIKSFFDNLKDVLVTRDDGFGPQTIYNVDETGVVTVRKPCKIVAERGVKQVGATVSQERGTLVTLCCGVDALGMFIPPYFLYPRVKVQYHWLLTAPSGSAAAGLPEATEWMTADNFLGYMNHFTLLAKPSAEQPVLLILDNRHTHIDIDVLIYAKDNHITLLSFPPHCSHSLQPLDRYVFGSLKKFLSQSIDTWMRLPENASKAMIIHILPSMVAYAFPQAFTPRISSLALSAAESFHSVRKSLLKLSLCQLQ